MPDALHQRFTPFQNRWRLTGTLTTESPLHIGDGFSVDDRLDVVDGVKREVQTICRNAAGAPFIPASSLKGPLRAWLKAAGLFQSDERWRELFGSDSDDAESARGGKLSFWDCRRSETQPPTFTEETQPTYWNAGSQTAVSVSVSIDRRTRTALEHHLFHIEHVPAGVEFAVELSAQNISEDDVCHLLGLLDQFNGSNITLGAGNVHGWGRVSWKLGKVYRLDAAAIASWLENNGTVPVGYAAATTEVTDLTSQSFSARRRSLTVNIQLRFNSPLLVRDSSKGEKNRKFNAKLAEGSENLRKADTVALLDASGTPFVPERAARGVIRSQVERILRTLGEDVPDPAKVEAVYELAAASALDKASKLFGASGWRGPVSLSDFTTVPGTTSENFDQDFVAIDRFTGAAATGKKFDVKAVTGACLQGTIHVDLKRLALVGADSYAPGLLALVLRDLCEGDLTFGSGAAKGYGACTASATIQSETGSGAPVTEWFASEQVRKSLSTLRAQQNP